MQEGPSDRLQTCQERCESALSCRLCSYRVSSSHPAPFPQERTLATQLFETADGRPSALAASIAAKATLNRSLSKGKAPAGSGTFEPGRTTNGAEDGGKRWLTAEEKKKISLAIEQSTSLEEIKRLEEKIKLGYTLDDLDPGAAEAKGGTAAKAKGKKQAAKPAEEEQEEEMDEDD